MSWVRPSSIHLTLKFLGEVEEARIAGIGKALEAAAEGIGPFTVTAEGVGGFPNLKGPRVVWVGIKEEPALIKLQKNIDVRLSALGFEEEARAFHPHLTLCRVKSPSDGRELGRVITETRPEVSEQWKAVSFSLYKSVLSPKGAQYSVLKKIDLK